MTHKFTFTISDIIAESIIVKTKLMDECSASIESCGLMLAAAAKKSKKIMFCGNGGSAADCQHLAAELVIRFRSSVDRPAIAAMALSVDPSIASAGGNDLGFENVFARQIEACGRTGDVLVGISTSGKSENVYRAMLEAKKHGVLTVGLLGCEGGKILAECDNAVVVPSDVTARIQESHIMIGHIWCEIIEEILFPELFKKNILKK